MKSKIEPAIGMPVNATRIVFNYGNTLNNSLNIG